eukprot:1921506-Pyramimonas_sp.AAC.2
MLGWLIRARDSTSTTVHVEIHSACVRVDICDDKRVRSDDARQTACRGAHLNRPHIIGGRIEFSSGRVA